MSGEAVSDSSFLPFKVSAASPLIVLVHKEPRSTQALTATFIPLQIFSPYKFLPLNAPNCGGGGSLLAESWMQRPVPKYEIKEIVAYISLPKTSPFHFSPPPPSKYSSQVCPQGDFLQFLSSLFSLKN